MRKFFIISTLILTACAINPKAQVIQGCNAYGSSLSILAAAKSQGRLTPEQIKAVNDTVPTALAICGAETPPADAQTALAAVNAQLERIIFQSGAK